MNEQRCTVCGEHAEVAVNITAHAAAGAGSVFEYRCREHGGQSFLGGEIEMERLRDAAERLTRWMRFEWDDDGNPHIAFADKVFAAEAFTELRAALGLR